ncbi:hypothetical protein ACO22_08178, partial [Paracoccidioides brasiliensis]
DQPSSTPVKHGGVTSEEWLIRKILDLQICRGQVNSGVPHRVGAYLGTAEWPDSRL